MTSRRKRLRRLLLWNRWIAHYPPTIAAPPAAVRAFEDAHRVEPHEGGWYDEPDDDDCCLAGDEDHDGPCVLRCSTCWGDGRCPDCGGEDDMGCPECDGTGSCPECHGDGQLVGDVFAAFAPRVVETLPVMGDVL